MMTLFEDLRLALRQICRAIGLSGTAAAVVPLIVLGVALNVAALNAMEYMRKERHPGHKHVETSLRSATRTEVKVVKAVLTSTLKTISEGKRRWCVARQWAADRKSEITGYPVEVGIVWAAPPASEGCDVEIVGSSHPKMAIAIFQC